MTELRHRVGQRPSESTGEVGYSGTYPQQQPSSYGNTGYYGGGSSYSYGGQQAPGAPSQAAYGQQARQSAYGGAYGQQQAYQSSGSGYSNTGNDGGSSYGGSYGGYHNHNNSGGAANQNCGANPYQKSSKSNNKGSGWSSKHIIFSILALILIVLIGSTFHFRNTLLVKQVALDGAKRALEGQGGRFGRGRADRQARKAEREVNKNKRNNRKKQVHPKQKQFVNKKMSDDLTKEIESLKAQLEEQQAAHADLTKQQTSSRGNLNDQLRKKQDVLKSLDHAKNELEDRIEDTAKYKAMVEGKDEVEQYMKKREEALWKRIDVLEKRVGQNSWREAEEWFGSGPHKVELTIEYPKAPSADNTDASTWPMTQAKLIIDLAPLDMMPHTVNLFLQQVHHGLWEGCHVSKNSNHIVQFGPSYDDKDHPAFIEERRPQHDGENFEGKTHYSYFYDYSLDKVTYQEYSKDYPHIQYTVGMAGRPSGPDFYINKIDNSMIHGPGGQTNRDDFHNEADPCFGKVIDVKSLEILKEIDNIPMDPERGFELQYPVIIKKSQVLVHSDHPEKGWEGVEQEWRAVYQGDKVKHGEDDVGPMEGVGNYVERNADAERQ